MDANKTYNEPVLLDLGEVVEKTLGGPAEPPFEDMITRLALDM